MDALLWPDAVAAEAKDGIKNNRSGEGPCVESFVPVAGWCLLGEWILRVEVRGWVSYGWAPVYPHSFRRDCSWA